MNVNLSSFRMPIASQIHILWQWLWDRICVGHLCGLDSGISTSLKDFGGSWEHKSSDISSPAIQLWISAVFGSLCLHKYTYDVWWQWLWDRICVGYLCGLDSGISLSLQHFCGSWEHKGGSKQEYNREVHCLLGAYVYTNTHMLVVVVRRNMRGVSVWTSTVRISVTQAGWRPIDMWNMWNVIF